MVVVIPARLHQQIICEDDPPFSRNMPMASQIVGLRYQAEKLLAASEVIDSMVNIGFMGTSRGVARLTAKRP